MFDPLEVIASESARFAELAATTPADTPIPSCPEWAAQDLVAHLGEVQRFWAGNVAAARPDQPTSIDAERPESSDLAAWMRASTELLLGALRQAGDDTPSWTWWDRPRTSGAVARHQVQEASVHRWDAEAAVGGARPLDAEVAHDGVGEFLEIMVAHDADGLPGTVLLRSRDTGGEWSVGGGAAASPGGSHTATITATASDLVLLLYGRIPLSTVDVAGPRSLPAALLSILVTE
jgi:uncharacterized protein (TIGR03083 family)